MRLRRLILSRYGHLSDVEISFPETPGLHVVLGANEAGKSTALAAIGDCLFRFPHSTPYDFLYPSRDLRIGVTLQARHGEAATFFRRKGRGDDLFDEDGSKLPESAIARFLDGATRERFYRVFGLNGAELRQGGNAILQGRGEASEALLDASTGLRGFRDVVAQLDSDAGKLFGNRQGRRQFHEAAIRFQDASAALRDRRIEPEEWKKARAERDRLEQAQLSNTHRLEELHAEQSRLNRIHRTTPARLALTRLLREQVELGPIPNLPDDAAERHQAATAARDQARRDLTREQERAEALASELAVLPENDPILSVQEAIDSLAADRQRIAGAVSDREKQRLIAEQQEAAIAADARALGLTPQADAIATRIPTAFDQAKVRQALGRYQRLSALRETAEDALATATAHLTEAQAALDDLPPADPPHALRQIIEEVKAEGRLDTECAEATRTAEAAAAELRRALKALPLWTNDAATLAAAALPMQAEIQRLSDLLHEREEAVRSVERVLEEHDKRLVEYAAQALADEALGELPTVEVIQAARDHRDHAWSVIRRVWLDQGDPLSDQERTALGPDPAGAFEALTRDADHLADRRAAERERVVAVERRRAEQIARQALRDADEQRRLAAVAELEEARAAWRTLWQPSLIDPAEPAAMREWLQQRTTVLDRHQALLAAEQKLASLSNRTRNALARIASVFPAASETACGKVAPALRAAEQLCREQEQQAERIAKAQQAIEAASREHAEAARVAAKTEKDLTAWRDTWTATAASLALPPDAPPDLASTALTLWDQIDKAERARRAALDRVAEMTAAIDKFAADTTAITQQIVPELAETPPLEAIRPLSHRLAAARQTAAQRTDLTRRLQELHQTIEKHTQERADAEDGLAALQHQSGSADAEALTNVIARWSRARALAAEIRERRDELRKLDDGKTLEELAAEAEGLDIDALGARIDAIKREADSINAETLANQEALVRVRQSLEAMEQGRDAASAAQDMETALADIDDIAARYVPLRMAHTLLRAAIDRFRREQQGPLLMRASQLFARLTEGRYTRLEADEEDDGTVFVVAHRPDGTDCRADRLSEGTLDQLYLALRLAAIEGDARVAEPLPFIGDDLLVNFDDRRALAALRVLNDFARVTQVILFTHHGHIADMAADLASVHPLAAPVAVM